MLEVIRNYSILKNIRIRKRQPQKANFAIKDKDIIETTIPKREGGRARKRSIPEKIKSAIKLSKNGKASGVDGLSA